MKSLSLRAHLQAAQAYADLSKARRLKVGALIVKEDRPISVGFNGTPSGADNNCEYTLEGSDELVTKLDVIHAEKNAIAFAAKNGVSTDNCVLVQTHSPCLDCATLIIQAGIKEVYYEHEFRDTAGIVCLKENNVKVEKIT